MHNKPHVVHFFDCSDSQRVQISLWMRTMAFAVETRNAGFTLSESSIKEPYKKKYLAVSTSYPFVKPSMSDQPRQVTNIIRNIKNVCQQGLNKFANKPIESLSLDESKDTIRELAAELNRVLRYPQCKKLSLMFEKEKNKGTKAEQQYYILQWAEKLEKLQTKQKEVTQLLHNKEPTLSEKSRMDRKIKWKKARDILSDWAWKLKEMKQNSVCPNDGYIETLRDLHKQCKQGKSSILPVMDWMMWTVWQSESSEDSSARLWMKNTLLSKNAVGLRVPNSADVVVDLNTANPDLLVSKDGKSVRAGTNSDCWVGFQRKHFKFDGWACVQATRGYNRGRHYWEVDVKKKFEWRVGVVKESAPRKRYCTMNTRTGYWNLRLQLGTLMALTEPVTKLNLQTPSKIGIYLDLEEGQVSFYDAEKRRHIYTFNTDFNGTENIYPMFGTIETDRELVIL